MTGIIPLAQRFIAGKSEHTVSARILHEFLGVKKIFAAWIRDRIKQYGFIENQDFIVCFPKRESKSHGGHNTKDYYLALDTAKELAMVERTEKGREARRYFIECERQLIERKHMPVVRAYQRALVIIEDGKITSMQDLTDCSVVNTVGLRTIRSNLRLLTEQLRWLEGDASEEVLEKKLELID